MKMHFSIPLSEELLEKFGGRYVLYSVYLEGFLFCKARYSQLHRWNEQTNMSLPCNMEDIELSQLRHLKVVSSKVSVQQGSAQVGRWEIMRRLVCLETLGKTDASLQSKLRRIFGSSVPTFPPKFYLAMTKSMADERRSQLEQYLQNVTIDPNIINSDVFISFFQKLQQDTFKIQPQKACLDVYLADGRNIRLDIKTSDTAERILEVASYKMGLSRELIGYFSLFFIEDHNSGTLSVVKKVAEFELPYVSLQSMKQSHCKLGIRKWYMDPSLDKMLLDCRASVNLLYMQAVQEIERNWVKPTDEQMQKLELLQKTANKIKFLELVSEVQHYGYIKLDPCTCDYPEVGCSADVHVGNNEIYCCVKLPTNQTKVISFKINRVRCWQVTFLGAVTDANDEGTGETLELRFEYNDSDTWKWIVFYTKQAFLLSSCFKKMISEQLMKTTKEQELIEMPETSKSKNSSIQQNQICGFIPRKRTFVRPNEEDRVFEKIREEDL